MFVEYEFERDFADKACTLEYVMSQVDAGMGCMCFCSYLSYRNLRR